MLTHHLLCSIAKEMLSSLVPEGYLSLSIGNYHGIYGVDNDILQVILFLLYLLQELMIPPLGVESLCCFDY